MSIWSKYVMGYPDIRKLERNRDLEGLTKAINFQAVDQLDQRRIRREAIGALVRVGDTRALEPIIEILHKDSEHSTVLVTAFQGLGNIARRQIDPAVRERVINELSSVPDRWNCNLDMYSSLVEELEKLGWHPVTDTQTGYYYSVKHQWDRCVEVGATAAKPLCSMLPISDRALNQDAVDTLVKIGEPAVEPLLAMINERDSYVTAQVYRAVIRIGQPAVPHLTAILLDSSAYHGDRRLAAEALGEIGDPAAIEPLRKVAFAGIDRVSDYASAALSKIEGKLPKEARKKSELPWKVIDGRIPTISSKVLSIRLVDSRNLGSAGAGGASFQSAIQSMNSGNDGAALGHFVDALKQGLDPLRKGYVYSNLGIIAIKDNDLIPAIEHFLSALMFEEALYESVHDSAQYLSVVFAEVGRLDEANGLKQLVLKTEAKLGYSLAPSAIDHVRQLVRISQIK